MNSVQIRKEFLRIFIRRYDYINIFCIYQTFSNFFMSRNIRERRIVKKFHIKSIQKQTLEIFRIRSAFRRNSPKIQDEC